jgi:hypothetical protein
MSYVTTQSVGKIGETVNAILSDNNDPHQRHGVPVQAKLVSDGVLCIDNEPRLIISRVTRTTSTPFSLTAARAFATASGGPLEALARGTQSGIFSANEARAMEDLDAVPFGDEPRTQAQNIPLSAAGQIPSAPVPPSAPAAPIASYQNAVKKDIEALRARARSTTLATEPPGTSSGKSSGHRSQFPL